jgi:hypothetical protein
MSALIEIERELARSKQASTEKGHRPSEIKVKELTATVASNVSQSTEVDKSKSYYLTPEEVSLRWREKITPETLANWRAGGRGMGPPYSKFGRAVLYRFDLLEKWEEKNVVLCDALNIKE